VSIRRLSVIAAAAAALAVAAGASGAQARTVWLCFPGHGPDPCAPGLSTTVYTPSLHRLRVIHPRPARPPAIDCFYVYPTVSDQPTGNANLHIDPEERSVALYQAARYSQYCRVFAPMYRQVTLAGIGTGSAPTTKPDPALALGDVVSAFRTYLRRYNHGRGFVLIGHSQGSFVLRQLIARQVEPRPAVRRRLVSAILLGGNVLVGEWRHIPPCRAATQTGCVIAFSTFDQPPPPDSLFGRAPAAGERVLCTNPAALRGGSGLLDPIAPSAPFAPGTLIATGNLLLHVSFPHPPTVWWTAPGSYSARCQTTNGATVLEIAPRRGAPDPTPAPSPMWGLHLLDANIALGNLIEVVRREAAAFAASGR